MNYVVKEHNLQDINNIIVNVDRKRNRNKMRNILEPVKYGLIRFIEFKNNEYKFIQYTDCFEISLLRFLHLLFGKNNKINLKKLMIFCNNNELLEFFKNNQIYSNESDYYETRNGFDFRAKWCCFLNNRNIFKYKKEDKYEVCASFDNLFNFFTYFFPNIKLNYDQVLQNIEENFNIIFKNVNSKYSAKVDIKITDMDEELYMNSYVSIFANKYNLYDWEIYQYFNKNNGIRRTGHSDFKFANIP